MTGTKIPSKLTHMPIGKNILYLSQQLMYCCQNNLELSDNTEKWVWSDIDENIEKISWGYYFNKWEHPIYDGSEEKYKDHLIFLSICCKSVFNPKNEFIINKTPTGKKIIGIHIRRGDAKYYDIKKVKPVDEYVSIIKNFDPEEYCVYCASESVLEIIDELRGSLPGFEIFYSNQSGEIPVIPKGMDIEFFCANNKQFIKTVVSSAIEDIVNLSKSDIFIGPYRDSVFSLVVALLIFNNSKRMIDIVTGEETLSFEDTNLGIPVQFQSLPYENTGFFV